MTELCQTPAGPASGIYIATLVRFHGQSSATMMANACRMKLFGGPVSHRVLFRTKEIR